MAVRAFIGISLPLLTRQMLTSAQHAMREASPSWRQEKWVAAENLHVTLKFLGPLPDGLLDEAARTLLATCSALTTFPLHVGEIVAVPHLRSATMLWAGIGEGADTLAEHAAAIDASLAAAGFPAETRGFKPHITLVRARGARRVSFETLDAGNRVVFSAEERVKRMSVRGATLYSSTLTPSGPVYEERAFAPFSE